VTNRLRPWRRPSTPRGAADNKSGRLRPKEEPPRRHQSAVGSCVLTTSDPLHGAFDGLRGGSPSGSSGSGRPTRQHDVDCPAPNPVERILKGVDAKVVTAGAIDLLRGRTAGPGERRCARATRCHRPSSCHMRHPAGTGDHPTPGRTCTSPAQRCRRISESPVGAAVQRPRHHGSPSAGFLGARFPARRQLYCRTVCRGPRPCRRLQVAGRVLGLIVVGLAMPFGGFWP